VPAGGVIQSIPDWSMPEFRGMLTTKVEDKDRHYLAAHIAVENGTRRTEVFLYQDAPPEFFQNLFSRLATISLDRGKATAAGLDIKPSDKSQKGVSFNLGRPKDDPDLPLIAPPPGRGWWDLPVSWLVEMPSLDLKTGEPNDSVAIVASRLSLFAKELWKFKVGAVLGIFFMLLTGTVFLIVELIAVVFAGTLTRSITRSVADIYAGTTKVQEGDFSHRIPVRKTKDQLSELAGSFNTMTGRIEDLIVEAKEKERLENELAIARDVQSQLFPKEVPQLKSLEVWGGCQPARTVSGDYYDYVSLDSDHAALAIGDISGKGISAALLMAHIQSALRTQLMHPNGNGHTPTNGTSSPASILSILNDHLYKSSPPEKYATFFLGLYSDDSGRLAYTNAGHLAPMLVRKGKVMRLAGEGFPVGLFPGIQYDQQTFTFEHGDLFVAFTDGVTETPNQNGEEFGDQRLTELLTRHSQESLERIAGEVSTAVGAWAGDRERHDDTTLLLARRL
jgi:sigma-B regulation protein RsbU (phosphoserine phosphatase)